MQVFVPSADCMETASQLDRKRLNKQIIENGQILKAIDRTGKGWLNHPATLMYRPYRQWLVLYNECLKAYMSGNTDMAIQYSYQASRLTPPFLTDEFCTQHRRRLFTKSPELYPQFAEYGTSLENWYFVDGKLLKYINGKRIN